LLGEVLTSLAPSNEFLSIAQGCGPVKSLSESLADQRARRCVVAADAFVDLLQDVLASFSENALHEYSRSGALHVELISDYYVGLGPVDDLLGQVLVSGNLLLADVVDEGLSPVHVYYHDLLTSCRRRWVSGRGRRLRDGWRVKLVDEDSRWYLCASRTKL
jgi:hypothetical protein